MTDRTPTRCRIRGCPAVGFWNPSDPRCPMHRTSEWDEPRSPTTAEYLDDAGRG